MRIAILGGSFDPPHLGHVFIAQQVREFLQIDQVWLMPVYAHAFHKKLSSPPARLAMTKLLGNGNIRASSFEIEQQQISYTINTLNILSKNYPQHRFFWILGSDQLTVFQKYKNWQAILSKHSLIIFPRESVLPQFLEKVQKCLQLQTIPKNVIVLQNEELILTNVSSTKIRERVRKGLSIRNFVIKEVERYIADNNLYKNDH